MASADSKGNAFTDWITDVRKIFFGYTEEEKEKAKETFKKVKEQEKKPVYDAPVGAIQEKLGLNSANAEMFIGLFVFLILVMMFKR